LSNLREFLVFIRWSLEFLVVDSRNTVITVALVVAAIATLAWRYRQTRPRDLAVLLTQGAAPLPMLALGVTYACENCSPSSLGHGTRHQGAEWAASGAFLAQVLYAIWLVYRARGFRADFENVWPTTGRSRVVQWSPSSLETWIPLPATHKRILASRQNK